jgi:hypothetical protein
MPDLDHLLRSDIARTASRSVDPPPLETVVTRGRRLRDRRRVRAAAVCVLVALAAGGGFLGRGVLTTSPAPADPQPTPQHVHRTPVPDRAPTAEQVVDDPAASVVQVVTAAEDPDVRAVLWQRCLQRCHTRHAAIALTTDGFATRTVVSVDEGAFPYLHTAGPTAFLVTNDGRRPYLLDTDGSRRKLGAPTAAVPVRAAELVTRWGFAADFVALDPASGAVHRVPVPAGTMELQSDGPRRLEALVSPHAGRTTHVAWSDDGGATWRDHPLATTDRSLYQLVPSAAPGTVAVLGGSDGATLFPFQSAERGTVGGVSWRSFPQGTPPSAFVDGGVVLPDGRLLLRLEQVEETFRPGFGSEPRMGLYVSDGEDWSGFSRLDPPDGVSGLAPKDLPWLRGADLTLAGMSVAPGRATVYVTEHGGNRVFAVADGRSWFEVRAR